MVQNLKVNDMDLQNLAIVRQTFANTVFTHKVHEVASEKQTQNSYYVKIVNIALVSVVLVLLLVQTAQPDKIWLSYLGAGLSVAEIIFLIIQLSFSYEDKMVLHKNSALKYMGLRDKYRSLITDIMNQAIPKKAIIEKRDSLQREYQVISDLSPQTGPSEYQEAQRRLNKRGSISGEEFTWSDEEIDQFLPEELRLNTSN